MGIIKAALNAAGSTLADQWLDAIEPNEMSDNVVFTKGVQINRKSSNTKATDGVITDGSVIHVYDNQFLILVDGGRIIDYTAEPGYFKVDNNASPSLFNGDFKAVLSETFDRLKFGGAPSGRLQAFYINLQEIKGIKFGTRNPINYFDSFYQAELFLRAHGTYSIRITDPLKFYTEVVPKNADRLVIDDINEQYMNEFLSALQSSINQLSVNGERISFVTSKSRELSKLMGETLDEEWTQLRGFEVLSVGLGSISYDETSQKLINMRNEGAMLSDPTIREGYVQGSVARGLEAAGSNPGGATAGFVGIGLGGNASGNMTGAFSQTNQQQMMNQQQQQQQQQQMNQQQQQQPAASWTCSCGNVNHESAQFCPSCGLQKAAPVTCAKCGNVITGEVPNFCPKCGNKL